MKNGSADMIGPNIECAEGLRIDVLEYRVTISAVAAGSCCCCCCCLDDDGNL